MQSIKETKKSIPFYPKSIRNFSEIQLIYTFRLKPSKRFLHKFHKTLTRWSVSFLTVNFFIDVFLKICLQFQKIILKETKKDLTGKELMQMILANFFMAPSWFLTLIESLECYKKLWNKSSWQYLFEISNKNTTSRWMWFKLAVQKWCLFC